MNQDADPFPEQVPSSKNGQYKEKVSWKFGRHVKLDRAKELDQLVVEYKRQVINNMKD